MVPLNARIGWPARHVLLLDHHVAQHEDLVVEVTFRDHERVAALGLPGQAGLAERQGELDGQHVVQCAAPMGSGEPGHGLVFVNCAWLTASAGVAGSAAGER